jgi:hypothetical protein
MTRDDTTPKTISIDPDSWKFGKPPSPKINVLNPHGATMTCDDIIRLAREAGFVRVVATHADGSLTTTVAPIKELERFAALVAAAEREACAKVCERISKEFVFEPRSPDPVYCADAIRARGET